MICLGVDYFIVKGAMNKTSYLPEGGTLQIIIFVVIVSLRLFNLSRGYANTHTHVFTITHVFRMSQVLNEIGHTGYLSHDFLDRQLILPIV